MDANAIVRRLGAVSSLLRYLGAAALFLMMLLTTADVVGRHFFNAPILGAFELTRFLVLIVIFSFLGHTQSQKRHVSVEALYGRLPKRARIGVNLFNHTICLVLMALIAWMGLQRALDLMAVGETSMNLGIPVFPFVLFLVLGCVVMCIEYVRDLVRLYESRGKDAAA